MATQRPRRQMKQILLVPWQEFVTRVRSIRRDDLKPFRKIALQLGAGLLLLYIGILIGAWISAEGTADKKLETAFVPSSIAPATNLVVVTHNYTGSTNTMLDVQRAIQKARPHTDILMVEHPAAWFSNADCFQLADQLCNTVSNHWSTGRYQGVEFVGHSMGALLVRKAYVYGWGRVEDMAGDENEDAPPLTRPPQAWVTNTTRMVLLAGMNRGWTTRNRPNGMSFSRWTAIKAGKLMGFITGTGKMIQQCEAGHPFVANLRMQWLEVHRSSARHPLIVQLLGDADDLVTREDERDISVSKDFLWVQLSGTTHENAANFENQAPSPGTTPLEDEEKLHHFYAVEREKKFIAALGGTNEIALLRRSSPEVPSAEDTNVVAGVVVLHGIRDLGSGWTSQFEDALQTRFAATDPGDKKLIVYRPTYGYFDMISFLLPYERASKVRWFMDELTELQARYPNMTNLHFIGHSHGTFVLATALKKYRALKLQRAVFAGSVVPQHFNWASPALSNRIQRVRNYVGSHDIVVALFPRLFELMDGNLGSAGFNGFLPPTSDTNAWANFMWQTKCVKGGHSAAITPGDTNLINSIAAFTINDQFVTPENTTTNQWWLANKVTHPVGCPLAWLFLLTVVGFVGIYGTWGIRKGLPYLTRINLAIRHRPLVLGVLAWAIYLIIVWQLLKMA